MERYELLEQRWSRSNDLDPAGMVACNSGTAALHLAFEALDLPRGSQCIMSDYNMIACPRAAVMAGVEPVFVDCDERLLLGMDGSFLTALTAKTNAILLTHVYGRQCLYPDGWETLPAPPYVIEDLAEAHGLKPHPGTDVACWSFYSNKVVAGEEGGCVWFCNPLRAKLARKLRCLGFTSDHDYTHVPRGHNYRLANCLADKILLSLADYWDNMGKRRDIEELHNERCPAEWRMPLRQIPWVYDLRIPEMTKETQDTLVSMLKNRGVMARHGFKPMTWQKEFLVWRSKGEWTNSDKAATEVIYLPLDPVWHPHRQEHVKHCWETIHRTIDYAKATGCMP